MFKPGKSTSIFKDMQKKTKGVNWAGTAKYIDQMNYRRNGGGFTKPVINWISFSLTADGYSYFTKYWMPGMPWEHADHLWKHFPLSLVGNVKTPTMLLTGEVDYRTPMSETEQYYQALKLQNVDAAMVRIPKAAHGIAARPSNLIQKVGNILAWFEKYKTAEK